MGVFPGHSSLLTAAGLLVVLVVPLVVVAGVDWCDALLCDVLGVNGCCTGRAMLTALAV